jgi:hypothetical protein
MAERQLKKFHDPPQISDISEQLLGAPLLPASAVSGPRTSLQVHEIPTSVAD